MGAEAKVRQTDQDTNAASAQAADSLAQRAIFKNSCNYNCPTWDLCDGIKAGQIKLAELKPEQLPEEMRKMTMEQRKTYVETKTKEREGIQKQIAELSKQREVFVAAETKRKAQAEGV